MSNEKILEQVANEINSVTIKSFLRQTCTVRSITDDCVTLEVGSNFLYQVGERMLDKIREGFTKVMDRKINIIFVVKKED